MNGPVRVSNIEAVLQVLHEAGSALKRDEILVAQQAYGLDLKQVTKALENAKTRGFVDNDVARSRAENRWRITQAGLKHLGVATQAAEPVGSVNPNEARPWAYAATRHMSLPGPAAPAGALPSMPADSVQHLPVVEVDIDAVHRRPAAAAPAVSVPLPTTADDPRDTGDNGPEFLCALYSDGVLSIESHGHAMSLPVEHTRRLLHYLDGLACHAIVQEAAE